MLRLGEEVIIFDGGLGSEIEKLGLNGIPEELNVTHPEEIKKYTARIRVRTAL